MNCARAKRAPALVLADSAQALLDFMNGILEAVNIETGELPVFRRKFNLQEEMEKVVRLGLPKAVQKGLDLKLHYDGKLPRYFVGGIARIQRIVLELANNALNFTQQGFIEIRVENLGREGRKIIVKLSVVDTGVRIPPEKQPEIYLRFRRLTPSYQRVHRGLGLGLSIVKQFIDDLGGELYVDFQLGQGSSFHCLLPLDPALLDSAQYSTCGAQLEPNVLPRLGW